MKRKYILGALAVLFVGIGLLGAVYLWRIYTRSPETMQQTSQLLHWFGNVNELPEWSVEGGTYCLDAPMMLPTSGYVGFVWDDSFYPGHRHSGLDIFSPDRENNVTPIVASHDGYLTRDATWKSTIIIRHPTFLDTLTDAQREHIDDLLSEDEQIWTYYTHMASADGETSYITPDFPQGTYDVFVEAGTVIGYQGNWSGSRTGFTGLHLHFSIAKSNPDGSYANESLIDNTYDPVPFLGLEEVTLSETQRLFRCRQ